MLSPYFRHYTFSRSRELVCSDGSVEEGETSAPVLSFSSDFLSPIGRIYSSGSVLTGAVATSSLSAYYPLNSSSADVASANNGVDTSISYNTAKVGQGATFNGSASKILIPGALPAFGDMTYSAWVKTSGTIGQIISDNTSGTGWVMRLFLTGGKANFALVNYGVGGTTQLLSQSTINDNAWHHVVGTRSGTLMSLYIDGVLSSTTTVSTVPTSNIPLALGCENYAGTCYEYFGGMLDEVGIWGRSLSSVEVSALYNQGSGLAHPFLTGSTVAYTPDYTGTYIDQTYTPLPTVTYGALPAVAYPYATSSVATSTINRLTVATTTSYTVYTPLSNYVQDSRGTKTTYLTLNGTLVGVYTYQTGQEASTGKLSYVLTNYLGTPTVTTDDKGDITELGITDVFGNYKYRDTRKDAALHTKTFTGHEWGDTTGLVYSHARYLDTKAHTFLSVDPMLYSLPSSYLTDPQQMNSYAYARNNPVTMTDPTGMATLPSGSGFTLGALFNAVVSIVSSLITTAYLAVTDNNRLSSQIAAQGNKAVSYLQTNGYKGTVVNSYNSVVSSFSAANKTTTFSQGFNAGYNSLAGSVTGAALTAGVSAFLRAGAVFSASGESSIFRTSLSTSETASQLTSRALQVNKVLDPVAQRMRTSAVLRTSTGDRKRGQPPFIALSCGLIFFALNKFRRVCNTNMYA